MDQLINSLYIKFLTSNFKSGLEHFGVSRPLFENIKEISVMYFHKNFFVCCFCFFLTIFLITIFVDGVFVRDELISPVMADPLEQMNFSKINDVYSKDGLMHITLIADYDVGKIDNKSFTAMLYNGSLGGPTLHVLPGDKIILDLVNNLNESTNLHFHGLHVSPTNNSDNVFLEVAPGKKQEYVVDIPADHPVGTYWYHSHMHRKAYEQVSAGLSGIIVIEGLEKLLPKPLQNIKQQIIALRDFPVNSDPALNTYRTVNGKFNPILNISSGETQLWRIANIGSETFYKIGLPNHVFRILAEDGNPVWNVWNSKDLLLPSGKRFDVLVTANGSGPLPLLALPYYPYPETLLAYVNIQGSQNQLMDIVPTNLTFREDLDSRDISNFRVLNFSSDEEDSKYFINNNLFDPNRIDQVVKLGSVEEWKLVNLDEDEHPFHIHTNAFEVITVNGKPYDANGFQDSVLIPGHGQVVIRIPFEDYVGKAVYHCHIMFHEDGGMMGVFEVVP